MTEYSHFRSDLAALEAIATLQYGLACCGGPTSSTLCHSDGAQTGETIYGRAERFLIAALAEFTSDRVAAHIREQISDNGENVRWQLQTLLGGQYADHFGWTLTTAEARACARLIADDNAARDAIASGTLRDREHP